MNYLGWNSSVQGDLFYLGWLNDETLPGFLGGGGWPLGIFYADMVLR